jgi:4'-phosphopantetheinyl transferase EntD
LIRANRAAPSALERPSERGPGRSPDGPSVLARLFEGWPVVTEEIALSEDIPAPHPLEAEQVGQALPGRRREFAAGRHCARRALARLGVGDFALLNGPDRAPRWPPGIVGAITHTGQGAGGFCGVVLGQQAEVTAVGLDAERGTLAPDLWRAVLTASERRGLEALAKEDRGRAALLAFSAKECFYKAQFPLTRRFLELGEVEVAVEVASGTFEVTVRSNPAVAWPLRRCRGRFLVVNDLVVTGIAVPRLGAGARAC